MLDAHTACLGLALFAGGHQSSSLEELPHPLQTTERGTDCTAAIERPGAVGPPNIHGKEGIGDTAHLIVGR